MGSEVRIGLGALLFVGGIALTAFSSGNTIYYGAILVGLFMLFRGFADSVDGNGEEYEEAAPAGTPARLVEGHISQDDYPSRALRDEAEGTVVVGFTVDTSGRVIGAHTVQSSGHQSLDDAACRIMSDRFRYEPATDPYGTAVPENRTQSIKWQLAD